MNPTLKRKCIFCHKSTDDPINLGKMETTRDIYGHYYCILLSATITQSGRDKQGIWGFMPKDILNELKITKNYRCCYCRYYSANLKCHAPNCNARFHLPCGLKNKISIEFCGEYKTFCDNHRKPLIIPDDIKNSLHVQLCVICYENFSINDDQSSVISAPCCKTSVYHISCLRAMALNAGYYMKCPTCSNNDTFIKHLRENGIFVPERDATWETENGAYQELLDSQVQCGADDCLCPSGRQFCRNGSGPWHIFKCELCGSEGVHLACLIAPVDGRFICNTCRNIEFNKNNTETNLNADTSNEKPDIDNYPVVQFSYTATEANTNENITNDVLNFCTNYSLEKPERKRHYLTRRTKGHSSPGTSQEFSILGDITNNNKSSSTNDSNGPVYATVLDGTQEPQAKKLRFSERLKKKMSTPDANRK